MICLRWVLGSIPGASTQGAGRLEHHQPRKGSTATSGKRCLPIFDRQWSRHPDLQTPQGKWAPQGQDPVTTAASAAARSAPRHF